MQVLIASGREILRFTRPEVVVAVASSPEGHYVAAGNRDHTARLYKFGSEAEAARMVHLDEIVALAFGDANACSYKARHNMITLPNLNSGAGNVSPGGIAPLRQKATVHHSCTLVALISEE